MALLGQKKEPVVDRLLLWGGRGVIWWFFLGSTTCLLCWVHACCTSYNGNPIIYNTRVWRITDKIHKKTWQNVNVTKQARFATLASSIIDNLCLIQQYKWDTTIVGRFKQVRVYVWTVCRDKKEAIVKRVGSLWRLDCIIFDYKQWKQCKLAYPYLTAFLYIKINYDLLLSRLGSPSCLRSWWLWTTALWPRRSWLIIPHGVVNLFIA